MYSLLTGFLLLAAAAPDTCLPPASLDAALQQPSLAHVFLGRVLRIRADSLHNVIGADEYRLDYYGPFRAVELLVSARWKGAATDTMVVMTDPRETPWIPSGHSLEFRPGDDYLVFATQLVSQSDTFRFESPGDELIAAPTTTVCLGTRRAREAATWIAQLQSSDHR